MIPTLVLDRSNPIIGLQVVDEKGQPVPLEQAFNGFYVSADDANAILTLALNFIHNRDAQHG